MIGILASRLPEHFLDQRVAELEERVRLQAGRDGVGRLGLVMNATLDLRYRGQGHQIPVPYEGKLAAAFDAFHTAHKRAFGYDRRDEEIDIRLVRLRGTAPAPSDRLPLPKIRTGENPLVTRAQLWVDGGFKEVPVYDRAQLEPDTELVGPLIIEQQDTTLIVGAQTLRVDAFGGISVRMKP